jgi:hypothetical protein
VRAGVVVSVLGRVAGLPLGVLRTAAEGPDRSTTSRISLSFDLKALVDPGCSSEPALN